jgi:hypothetical protein
LLFAADEKEWGKIKNKYFTLYSAFLKESEIFLIQYF